MENYLGKLILIGVIIVVGVLYYGFSTGMFGNTGAEVSKNAEGVNKPTKIEFLTPTGFPVTFKYDPDSGNYVGYVTLKLDTRVNNSPITALGVPDFKSEIVSVEKTDDGYLYKIKVEIPKDEAKTIEKQGLTITTNFGGVGYFLVNVIPPEKSSDGGLNVTIPDEPTFEAYASAFITKLIPAGHYYYAYPDTITSPTSFVGGYLGGGLSELASMSVREHPKIRIENLTKIDYTKLFEFLKDKRREDLLYVGDNSFARIGLAYSGGRILLNHILTKSVVKDDNIVSLELELPVPSGNFSDYKSWIESGAYQYYDVTVVAFENVTIVTKGKDIVKVFNDANLTKAFDFAKTLIKPGDNVLVATSPDYPKETKGGAIVNIHGELPTGATYYLYKIGYVQLYNVNKLSDVNIVSIGIDVPSTLSIKDITSVEISNANIYGMVSVDNATNLYVVNSSISLLSAIANDTTIKNSIVDIMKIVSSNAYIDGSSLERLYVEMNNGYFDVKDSFINRGVIRGANLTVDIKNSWSFLQMMDGVSNVNIYDSTVIMGILGGNLTLANVVGSKVAVGSGAKGFPLHPHTTQNIEIGSVKNSTLLFYSNIEESKIASGTYENSIVALNGEVIIDTNNEGSSSLNIIVNGTSQTVSDFSGNIYVTLSNGTLTLDNVTGVVYVDYEPLEGEVPMIIVKNSEVTVKQTNIDASHHVPPYDVKLCGKISAYTSISVGHKTIGGIVPQVQVVSVNSKVIAIGSFVPIAVNSTVVLYHPYGFGVKLSNLDYETRSTLESLLSIGDIGENSTVVAYVNSKVLGVDSILPKALFGSTKTRIDSVPSKSDINADVVRVEDSELSYLAISPSSIMIKNSVLRRVYIDVATMDVSRSEYVPPGARIVAMAKIENTEMISSVINAESELTIIGNVSELCVVSDKGNIDLNITGSHLEIVASDTFGTGDRVRIDSSKLTIVSLGTSPGATYDVTNSSIEWYVAYSSNLHFNTINNSKVTIAYTTNRLGLSQRTFDASGDYNYEDKFPFVDMETITVNDLIKVDNAKDSDVEVALVDVNVSGKYGRLNTFLDAGTIDNTNVTLYIVNSTIITDSGVPTAEFYDFNGNLSVLIENSIIRSEYSNFIRFNHNTEIDKIVVNIKNSDLGEIDNFIYIDGGESSSGGYAKGMLGGLESYNKGMVSEEDDGEVLYNVSIGKIDFYLSNTTGEPYSMMDLAFGTLENTTVNALVEDSNITIYYLLIAQSADNIRVNYLMEGGKVKYVNPVSISDLQNSVILVNADNVELWGGYVASIERVTSSAILVNIENVTGTPSYILNANTVQSSSIVVRVGTLHGRFSSTYLSSPLIGYVVNRSEIDIYVEKTDNYPMMALYAVSLPYVNDSQIIVKYPIAEHVLNVNSLDSSTIYVQYETLGSDKISESRVTVNPKTTVSGSELYLKISNAITPLQFNDTLSGLTVYLDAPDSAINGTLPAYVVRESVQIPERSISEFSVNVNTITQPFEKNRVVITYKIDYEELPIGVTVKTMEIIPVFDMQRITILSGEGHSSEYTYYVSTAYKPIRVTESDFYSIVSAIANKDYTTAYMLLSKYFEGDTDSPSSEVGDGHPSPVVGDENVTLLWDSDATSIYVPGVLFYEQTNDNSGGVVYFGLPIVKASNKPEIALVNLKSKTAKVLDIMSVLSSVRPSMVPSGDVFYIPIDYR